MQFGKWINNSLLPRNFFYLNVWSSKQKGCVFDPTGRPFCVKSCPHVSQSSWQRLHPLQFLTKWAEHVTWTCYMNNVIKYSLCSARSPVSNATVKLATSSLASKFLLTLVHKQVDTFFLSIVLVHWTYDLCPISASKHCLFTSMKSLPL